MARDEPGIDPFQEEFFATEELEDLNGALVREAIQNSLDARAGDGPVEVLFSFGQQDDSRNAIERAEVFRDLAPHLRSPSSGLARLPLATELLDFIVVEDFGTFGLRGNPEIFDDSAENMAEEHFYYFWRNIGRSQKDKMRLGRWGLGKHVFPASSRINGFFGLTCRDTDRKRYLMGQTVLKVHKLSDGKRYFPYGWFGVFPGNDAFAMPVEDDSFISRFRQNFGLRRDREPGLSIVIPYPRPELVPSVIIRAAILHYFHPILSGKLTVSVRFRDQQTTLRADTVREAIDRYFKDRSASFISMIGFSEWAINLPEDQYERLPEPDPKLTSKWSNVVLSLSQEQRSRIRERFERDRRIALRVPVRVQKKGEEGVIAWFDLYLERDEHLQTGEARFIREGISVTHANPCLERGLRGLVVIHDPVLVSLLGDAEPPAHDRWNQHSRALRENYENGASTVGFVRQSLQAVYRKLLLSGEDKDTDLLKDLFYVDKSALELPVNTNGPSKKRGRKVTGIDVEPVETRRPLIRVQKLDAQVKGFEIVPASDETPVSLTIKVAYMVRRGSPLRNYHPYDFDLGRPPVSVSHRNVVIRKCKGNELEAEILDHDFMISVTGFDANRDLFVKAIPTRADNDSEVQLHEPA